MPDLLKLAVDERSFETVEKSRLAVYILANLSSTPRLADHVVTALGRQMVAEWIVGIDDMKDERLKIQAERAKEGLSISVS